MNIVLHGGGKHPPDTLSTVLFNKLLDGGLRNQNRFCGLYSFGTLFIKVHTLEVLCQLPFLFSRQTHECASQAKESQIIIF